ncbi:MAG: tripartite tricarboxylate transporter substrate binding protein [Fervidobacterium sp.]|uniref:tripartite tricarboxylate transporter substrate binding protein n=1 Tax=Fervidobacterium sp. TaxID=1871331 RepID=UPI00309F6895
MLKRFLTVVLTLVVLLVGTASLFAAYPEKPVTVVVPYSAGGASDIMARLIAEFWKKYTGKDMVVTNVVGAEGAVAAQQMLTTRPDGYTVLWYHQAILGNYYLGVANIKWTDFTPACVVTKTARITAARADAPWKNLKEAIEDAKKNPKKYVYGAGAGGIAYLEYAPVEMAAPGAFRVVPNEGGDAQRITALLGGHVDVVPLALVSAVQYIKNGQIKVLALHDDEPDPFIPDAPTSASLGLPELNFPMTNTFFFPPKTLPGIVSEFNKIIAKIVADPEFKKKLAEVAYATPFFKTGKDLEDFWKKQDAIHKKAAETVK